MLADVVYSLASCSKTNVVFLSDEQLCVVVHCFEPLDYLCGYLTGILVLSQLSIGGTLAEGVNSVAWVCEYYNILSNL